MLSVLQVRPITTVRPVGGRALLKEFMGLGRIRKAKKEKDRIQAILDHTILPQFRSLGVAAGIERDVLSRGDAMVLPESAAQTVAVSFLFGNKAPSVSMHRVRALLSHASPETAEAFLGGLQFKSPAELEISLKMLEEVQGRLAEFNDLPREEKKRAGFRRMKRIGVSLGFLERAGRWTRNPENVVGIFYAAVLHHVSREMPGFDLEEGVRGMAEGFNWGARVAEKGRIYPLTGRGWMHSPVVEGSVPGVAQRQRRVLSWTHLPSDGSATDREQSVSVLANEVMSASLEPDGGRPKTLVVITGDSREQVLAALKKNPAITEEYVRGVEIVLIDEKQVVEKVEGPDGRIRTHYLVNGVLRAIAQLKSTPPGLENLEENIKSERMRILLSSPHMMDWRLGEISDPDLKNQLLQVLQLLQVMNGMMVEVVLDSLTGDLEKEWFTRIQA
jgi:hypothetical protein